MPQLWEGYELIYIKQRKLIRRLQTGPYFQLKEFSFYKWQRETAGKSNFEVY